MFHELSEKFDLLGKRFSSFYSDGGMSLEIRDFAEKPSLDAIFQHYRSEGWTPEEITEIDPKVANCNELLKAFTDFYREPKLGFSDIEISKFLELFVNSVDDEVVILHIGKDEDCYFLDLLSSSRGNWYLFDFYYQYD